MFRLTLSAPASTAAAASSSVRMPPPTASGMNSSRATARIVSASARRALERRGDVEDDELVDAFDVVAARELRRIAGDAQPLEVDALDDLAVADVEAGDDALGEHHTRLTSRPARSEVAQDLQPDVARFLRDGTARRRRGRAGRRRRTARRARSTATVSAVTGAT